MYLLVVLLVGGVLLARAVRPVDRVTTDRFLRAYGLDVGAESRGVVQRYLQRSRRWRAAGFLAPFAVGSAATGAWALADAQTPPQPWQTLADPRAWLAGYLLAAVLAELTWPRPVTAAGGRSAALLPRQPRQYLPTWVLPCCWALAALALLAELARRWLPVQDGTVRDRSGIVLAATAVGMAGLLHLAARAVVRRRQPFASAEQLAVDDAIRSASLHRAAGAGLAVVLLVLAGRIYALAVEVDVAALRFLLPVLTLACLLAAARALSLRDPDRWRVRRAPTGRPPSGGQPA